MDVAHQGIAAAPAARRDPGGQRQQVFGQRQDQGQRVLGDGPGVAAGAARDQDAAPRGLRHVNVVHADAVPGDDAQVGRGGHRGGADRALPGQDGGGVHCPGPGGDGCGAGERVHVVDAGAGSLQQGDRLRRQAGRGHQDVHAVWSPWWAPWVLAGPLTPAVNRSTV